MPASHLNRAHRRTLNRKHGCLRSIPTLAVPFLLAGTLVAQAPEATPTKAPYAGLNFRQIGPFRGGRVGAVTGVQSQPMTFYFGATGGGIFKTTDGGIHWAPVADKQLALGSVGAIAVSDSDPNIVYVGMGEADLRGNASHGDGVYKSADAGKTWKHMGLTDTQQIGAIKIDPKNPDIAYVAAMGHMTGYNADRGVFKTVDGGKTWKKVLFKSDRAGAIDLSIDPTNSQVLYASIYQFIRKPWTFESGGPDSGLWKSTDGGETWTDLSKNPGMPKGLLGRIGIAISPAKSGVLWTLVEAEEGGIFRSEDGGATWAKVNDQREVKQRAWYYARIFADPKNADTMYALNTSFYKSVDGGHTFRPIPTGHGDNHDLWIANDDPQRMIESNDGGANISFDGGKSFSTIMNQPTGQFYRVITDNDFPYHIYGAQQDNSTVETSSRGNSGLITESDWWDVGGGESGWIAPDPTNSRFVYAGSYDGLLTRYDHATGGQRNINPWPDNPMGSGVEAMKYRMQWNFPLLFSPNDNKLLYAGAQYLLGTRDEGRSWQVISPDLTRNDKSKQGPVGGPLTKDNTAVEYYDTIFTVDESTVKPGLIWVGSDDGLVHLTQDGGKTWANVTPKGIPDWIRINCIAASPFDAGTAYFAATLYLTDDYRPFLYKTTDFGKTWKLIVSGIPTDDFTRTIRPDPKQKGLLFAGTEAHLYISTNDGDSWTPFQLNLPNVPITDITFQKREDDMVIATQGRGFYVMDDMPLVRSLPGGKLSDEPVHLYAPKATYRYIGGGGFGGGGAAALGKNPPAGVGIYYSFKEAPKGDIVIRIKDSDGKLVNEFTSKPEPKEPEALEEDEGRRATPKPTKKAGLNHYVWNLRYTDLVHFPGLIYWAAGNQGPQVVPGTYTIELTADGHTEKQTVLVKPDPRVPTTPEEYKKQLDLALQIADRTNAANNAVITIRAQKKQLDSFATSSIPQVASEAKRISAELDVVENELYQTKLRANEDALNFPIKLNNKLAAMVGVVSQSDTAPTEQSYAVFKDLNAQLQVQLDKLAAIESKDIGAFNSLVRDQNIPAVPLAK
ncbi:Uncharacterized protein SAMN05421819_0775 [Bryocella elongata]|uniref:Sortilin N-terminal domain-containing protein n=1 Tax=Bryocella elongata TaxID=863522 RepID=A0A1H5TXG7_9BACT|nr:glycosyl hydrolase [Bryocella elongata]SEF67420.1 Uncharacterized protein SAMN05421819_0775 [Bryocella elongata]